MQWNNQCLLNLLHCVQHYPGIGWAEIITVLLLLKITNLTNIPFQKCDCCSRPCNKGVSRLMWTSLQTVSSACEINDRKSALRTILMSTVHHISLVSESQKICSCSESFYRTLCSKNVTIFKWFNESYKSPLQFTCTCDGQFLLWRRP